MAGNVSLLPSLVFSAKDSSLSVTDATKSHSSSGTLKTSAHPCQEAVDDKASERVCSPKVGWTGSKRYFTITECVLSCRGQITLIISFNAHYNLYEVQAIKRHFAGSVTSLIKPGFVCDSTSWSCTCKLS